MGGKARRVINKIMLGVGLGVGLANFGEHAVPSKLMAQETEKQESEKQDYWAVIQDAINGGSVDTTELKKAIDNEAAAAKSGRYLNLESGEYKSNANDVYHVFFGGWKKEKLQKDVRVEFLIGMAMVNPNLAAKEVENAIYDDDKTIAIGAMEAAVLVDTKQAAVNILQKRVFDKDPEIVQQAYKSLYMMKSTTDALPEVMNKEGNKDRLVAYLDIAANYYLINSDSRMANIFISGLDSENRKEVLEHIVRVVEKTDIILDKRVRERALDRLLKGEWPGLMADVYTKSVGELVRSGQQAPNLTEIDRAISQINNKYEGAQPETKGAMNVVLGELYLARALLPKNGADILPLEEFKNNKINNKKEDDDARIGALKGLGMMLEWKGVNEDTKATYLGFVLDTVYKNENEESRVRNAAAEALGRNAFANAVGPFIDQLEKSENAELREGTAIAIYLYNEKKPLAYTVGGLEGVVKKEIKRITNGNKGSGIVLNYLLKVLGKASYREKKGEEPKQYTAPNLGVEEEKKPDKPALDESILNMPKNDKEEIKKAYAGLLEYCGWLAKANLLTETEADTIISSMSSIYEYAKGKEGSEKAELYRAIVFASSALATNYNKTDLAGIVASILDETYTKDPETAVYTLRILRGDLVKEKGKIKGGLAKDEKIREELNKLSDAPSTPDAKGENTHLRMLLDGLIGRLSLDRIKLLIEQEWPFEQKYYAIVPPRVLNNFDVLTDRV